ncbi:unnamed protein product [Amoebophrya sp. A25]|nr:unnamed protein product [Amoebophrya sp. A25]|eukprot:GSA25T00005916001.1
MLPAARDISIKNKNEEAQSTQIVNQKEVSLFARRWLNRKSFYDLRLRRSALLHLHLSRYRSRLAVIQSLFAALLILLSVIPYAHVAVYTQVPASLLVEAASAPQSQAPVPATSPAPPAPSPSPRQEEQSQAAPVQVEEEGFVETVLWLLLVIGVGLSTTMFVRWAYQDGAARTHERFLLMHAEVMRLARERGIRQEFFRDEAVS